MMFFLFMFLHFISPTHAEDDSLIKADATIIVSASRDYEMYVAPPNIVNTSDSIHSISQTISKVMNFLTRCRKLSANSIQ